MTRGEPLFKMGISLLLKIFGNFWDVVSRQEIYHTEQVISLYFITKIVHFVPLKNSFLSRHGKTLRHVKSLIRLHFTVVL